MTTTEGHALEQLAALAQRIYDEHAIKVDAVAFNWTDMTEFGDKQPRLVVVAARGEIGIAVTLRSPGPTS
jgi:hypothetical protein